MSASSDFQVLFLFADTIWHFKDILFVGFLVTFNAAGSHSIIALFVLVTY